MHKLMHPKAEALYDIFHWCIVYFPKDVIMTDWGQSKTVLSKQRGGNANAAVRKVKQSAEHGL